jgi:hypothetical protein
LVTQTAFNTFGLIDLMRLFNFPGDTVLGTVPGTCCTSDTFITEDEILHQILTYTGFTFMIPDMFDVFVFEKLNCRKDRVW